jgi:hypothetical protein
MYDVGVRNPYVCIFMCFMYVYVHKYVLYTVSPTSTFRSSEDQYLLIVKWCNKGTPTEEVKNKRTYLFNGSFTYFNAFRVYSFYSLPLFFSFTIYFPLTHFIFDSFIFGISVRSFLLCFSY